MTGTLFNTWFERLLASVQSRWTDLRIAVGRPRCRVGRYYERIYHYHIRKTAGTSLNAAFWSLADLDMETIGRRCRVYSKGLVFVMHSIDLIQEGRYFFGSSHTPAHNLVLPKNTFTITILRDPLERLISHYRYLSWALQDPRAQHREPFFKELMDEAEWLGDSFVCFLERMPRTHLLRQLYMFSPEYDVEKAAERISRCSAVLFTEEFTRGLQVLGEHLSLTLKPRRERVGWSPARLPISRQEREVGRKLLVPEYELLDRVKQRVELSSPSRQRDAR